MFHAATLAATTLAGLTSSLAAPPPRSEPDPEVEPDDDGEDTPVYRTVVDAPIRSGGLEAQRKLDATSVGFGTAVDVEALPGATPDDALAEVVARTPGANVRSLGGLGQFSSVSLRGSAPAQVAIFLDGVPLGGTLAGLVNLSDIPLDGIGRIEIHRGHVPIRYGSAAIGGAIDLVSKLRWGEPSVTVRAGYGSFGARSVGVAATTPLRRGLVLTTRASYGGAQGNFAYYDDAGTNVFTGDDRVRTRTNNDYDRVLTQFRLDGERGPWRWSAQQWFVGRWSGVAGPIGAPSEEARINNMAARTLGSIEHLRPGRRPGGRLTWKFGLGLVAQRYRDPAGELGINNDDQRLRAVDVYMSPRWRVPLWKGAFLSTVADVRPEWVDVDERVPEGVASGDAARSRWSVGVGTELEQFMLDRRILLAPAVRVDGVLSRFAVAANEGEPGDTGRDDAALGISPRMGTRIRVAGPLSLRGSVGRYFRPPTLLELFGDRGYIIGNEGLVPERGTSVDAGVVVDLERPNLAAYGSVAGFGGWSEDLITWTNAGRVTRPRNISAARVRGVEAALTVEPARRPVTLHTHYTLTDSEDRGADPTFVGQPLPGRPRHDLFARWTAGWPWARSSYILEPRVLYTAEFIAGTNLDPAGRLRLPPRVLQGVGAELHLRRPGTEGGLGQQVHFAFEVRNLLDVRTAAVTPAIANARPTPVAVSDFIGFPLPGRSLWGSIVIDFALGGDRR